MSYLYLPRGPELPGRSDPPGKPVLPGRPGYHKPEARDYQCKRANPQYRFCSQGNHSSDLDKVLSFSVDATRAMRGQPKRLSRNCLRGNDGNVIFYALKNVLKRSVHIYVIFTQQKVNNRCGANVASEQQHKQDLRRIYEREYEFSKSSLFT